MTDNQFNQLFELVSKSVNGIQRLEKGQEEMRVEITELKTDVAELKTDVAELKQGQARHEKGLQILNRTLTNMHGDWGNLRSRVEILEDEKETAIK